MVAYSFKRVFVVPIRAGVKQHTIRAERKRHSRIGEEVQLYCGMRTRGCFLIGRATCSNVQPIGLAFDAHIVAIADREPISDDAGLDAFARSDGFLDWGEMRAFWLREHKLVGTMGRWHGVIVFWKDFR